MLGDLVDERSSRGGGGFTSVRGGARSVRRGSLASLASCWRRVRCVAGVALTGLTARCCARSSKGRLYRSDAWRRLDCYECRWLHVYQWQTLSDAKQLFCAPASVNRNLSRLVCQRARRAGCACCGM